MRFDPARKTSSKLDLQICIPERPAAKVLYKLTLHGQALDCEIMHFSTLHCTLTTRNPQLYLCKSPKKKIHLQSSLVHIVPAHMVSVGVSGPTGPFIGCKETAFNRGCQTPRLQTLRSPINPRYWRPLYDSKGKLAASAPTPERRTLRRARGAPTVPSAFLLLRNPPNVHTRAFSRRQIRKAGNASAFFEPRPKDQLRLRIYPLILQMVAGKAQAQTQGAILSA